MLSAFWSSGMGSAVRGNSVEGGGIRPVRGNNGRKKGGQPESDAAVCGSLCYEAQAAAGVPFAGRPECGLAGWSLSRPATLEVLLKGFDRAGNLWKNDAQMLPCLKQWVGMPAVGWTANSGQRRSQNAQPGSKPLEQVIERIQRQRRGRCLPGGLDRKTGEPAQDRLPDQGGGETVARQHPGE